MSADGVALAIDGASFWFLLAAGAFLHQCVRWGCRWMEHHWEDREFDDIDDLTAARRRRRRYTDSWGPG